MGKIFKINSPSLNLNINYHTVAQMGKHVVLIVSSVVLLCSSAQARPRCYKTLFRHPVESYEFGFQLRSQFYELGLTLKDLNTMFSLVGSDLNKLSTSKSRNEYWVSINYHNTVYILVYQYISTKKIHITDIVLL